MGMDDDIDTEVAINLLRDKREIKEAEETERGIFCLCLVSISLVK